MNIKKMMFNISCAITVSLLVGCSSNNDVIDETMHNSDTTVFQYTPPKVIDVPDEVEPAIEIKTVSLFIQPNYRLDIDVPADTEFITDNYTFIYATDSSWSVQLLSNLTVENLSKEAGILNPESLSKTVIRSKANEKTAQQVAKFLIDGKAVVANCYNNPEVFSTISYSLQNSELVELSNKTIQDSLSDSVELSELPSIDNKDRVNVMQDIKEVYARQYLYEDGYLVVSKEIKKKSDVDAILGMRMNVTYPGAIADEFYSTDTLFYARYGTITVTSLSLNYNTTVSLWAVGDSGRDNLLAFIRGELYGES